MTFILIEIPSFLLGYTLCETSKFLQGHSFNEENNMIKNPLPAPRRFFAKLLIGTRLISVGTIFFLLLNNPAPASRQDFSAVPAKVDFSAPELTLEDLFGNPVTIRDYRGKVLLVNLWATWCPPCREEMPTLQAFYEKYKSHDFVLIAINQEEPLETVVPFVEEFGLTFPVWLDMDYQAQREFKTIGLPSSYVIDRNGKVRLMWMGGISEKNLEKFVPDIILE